MSRPQQITVLGATGSIGMSTLDVIARHPERYQVFALSGFSRLAELFALCVRHRPRFAVVPERADARRLQEDLRTAGLSTEVVVGEEALCQISSDPEVDTVMAAIVGAAGLRPTLAAVEAGKKILLANKEALVMTGALFMQAVRKSGSVLLPIDSEHNAIFQCLPGDFARGLGAVGVRRILLTASGGPFRQTPLTELEHVTPDQACAHPNWSMGRKISVDSASMMNKGLELIEACWLFDALPSQVEVVIHPQSVIHSLVDYVDGSVLAQLGNPDMRTPIANALAWPERIDSGVAPLDLFSVARLDFQAPDEQRFPCLRLARAAAEAGGSAPAMLNAANEVAVAAFLERRIRYPEIASIIEAVLNLEPVVAVDELGAVFAADAKARALTEQWLSRNGR
ncbi:1-deoxy-D-xylulose 5-phosphate reductoisomerase [Pseudomonas agarici]|uniref:1-deoxy-D-xylulose 5-phosphate reductoisomerase n=1 Tax=Pseudomonas agarici TaxID=46677 RepID=A0A0X1SY05_PSEAA|nr:1-deoxy-D-xylulose-5-phosphate reductoisomerase [Pseudomonas agarici]AMB84550.1 1-deoxy-D-xylulose 5-phosphate reductoisomerase [Pseudomonas agarici]NWB89749.1 1-deoxy-D-xylulose-5-phosphate reductoisomerase [Pseudomonas agarici]NWC10190.1 1-deoxy-D-xylulose-5-phosphate reductoisomerase [Pseudomonas agarici]SEK18541.1 1-deoxy-D-xylulose 5-phosphate reductoisomerase [Pseudomonas agarici]